MGLIVAMAVAGVIGLLAMAPVLGQTPVVQPGDVSTPAPLQIATPTRVPAALLPTVTAVPSASTTADMPALTQAGFASGQQYIVRAGDTLLSVALETGLDLEDVPCAVGPNFQMDQPLVIGDTLAIPPANMACHTVAAGETLERVGAMYGVTAEAIYLLTWNELLGSGLSGGELTPGTHLRVPLPLPSGWAAIDSAPQAAPADESFLARMLSLPVNTSPFALFTGSAEKPLRAAQMGPVPADWPYGSGHFTWPVYGWLSQSYRYDHRAIDVAAQIGTPVTAADRGVVVRAGWNDQGYGRFVIVDHNIDYLTLYAHLDRILVEEGEVVGQGQVIGTVGSTGNSTGPHLHFEIRDFGRLVNPLELLAVQ